MGKFKLIGLTFFKTIKHKQFNYTPRYYDKIKDEMQEKYGENWNKEYENSEEYRRQRISKGFRRAKTIEKEDKTSKTRLIILIIIMAIICYYLFLR